MQPSPAIGPWRGGILAGPRRIPKGCYWIRSLDIRTLEILGVFSKLSLTSAFTKVTSFFSWWHFRMETVFGSQKSRILVPVGFNRALPSESMNNDELLAFWSILSASYSQKSILKFCDTVPVYGRTEWWSAQPRTPLVEAEPTLGQESEVGWDPGDSWK